MADEKWQTTGRGGAGNFIQQSSAGEQRRATTAHDLEAQLSTKQDSELIQDAVSKRPNPQYTSTGRGGAGNYAPAEDTLPTIAAPTVSRSSDPPTLGLESERLTGRGGAGNYYYSKQIQEEQRREKEAQEEIQRQKISQSVAQQFAEDNDQTLARPERAALAGTGRELK